MNFFTQPLLLLIVGLVVPFLGPALHSGFKKNGNFLRGLDGLTLIVILGLVFLNLIPHAVETVGLWAIVIAVLSAYVPSLLEKNFRTQLARRAHMITLAVAVLGICLHDFTDGAVLASANIVSSGHEGAALALGVILHRMPVGLALWWLLKPSYGSVKTLLVLILMAAATAVGFFVAPFVIVQSEQTVFGIFTAIIAGSLLHVVLHRHAAFVPQSILPQHLSLQRRGGAPQERWQWAEGLGAVVGLAVVVLFLGHGHEVGHNGLFGHGGLDGHEMAKEHFSALQIFFNLAAESAPALVFAYFCVALLQAFLPAASTAWMRRGGNFRRALKGVAFGLPLPVCSCGVVPLYRTLIKQGAPLAAATAFFIATPELSLDAFLLSFPLLGKSFTLIRLAGAVIVALIIGWSLGLLFKKEDQRLLSVVQHESRKEKKSIVERLKEGARAGFGEMVDHTGPWIVLGLIVAALLQPILMETNLLRRIPDVLQVPFFALLGMPVYVCASGATPLVAVLLMNGISPGAALAFLITGPATNVTTFGVLGQLHGKKLPIIFAALVAVLSIGLGYLVDFFFATKIHPVALMHEHGGQSIYRWIFLGILGMIYLAALIRRGPRFFINQIIAFESREHDHCTDDSCCHGGKQQDKEKEKAESCCCEGSRE